MKPFNLEEAKAGKPVCRRNGTPARIICFDRINIAGYPIIALVLIEGTECPISYAVDGRYNLDRKTPHEYDLMMVTTKHEGWINIYHMKTDSIEYSSGIIYSKKEEALENSGDNRLIATVKIEWEE